MVSVRQIMALQSIMYSVVPCTLYGRYKFYLMKSLVYMHRVLQIHRALITCYSNIFSYRFALRSFKINGLLFVQTRNHYRIFAVESAHALSNTQFQKLVEVLLYIKVEPNGV